MARGKSGKHKQKATKEKTVHSENLAAARKNDERSTEPANVTLENPKAHNDISELLKERTPRPLITTSHKPHASTYEFAKEFCSLFPTAKFVKRGRQFDIKRIVEIATEKNFTQVLVINEDRKLPNALTLIHLPQGPTAYFKLSSIIPAKNIHGHGRPTPHLPELILNNFSTEIGQRVGWLLASLFPPVPQFEARQAVTFHNEKDFIFLRRHRYIFDKKGSKCDLQELGPRFTLKLVWVQKGTFDTKCGEYEFKIKSEMTKSRKTLFL